MNGTSNEDAIELLCKAVVMESVISASYQFAWLKDDIPLNLSNSKYMVCDYIVPYMYIHTYYLLLYYGLLIGNQ